MKQQTKDQKNNKNQLLKETLSKYNKRLMSNIFDYNQTDENLHELRIRIAKRSAILLTNIANIETQIKNLKK